MSKRVLIAVFSRTGHTKQVADRLMSLINDADQYLIKVPQATYSQDMYETADLAKRQAAMGELPPLMEKLPDFKQYDLILIGSPVWSGMPAMPVYSFLKKLQGFRGAVATFYTDAGMAVSYEQVFKKWAGSLKLLPAHRGTMGLESWLHDILNA